MDDDKTMIKEIIKAGKFKRTFFVCPPALILSTWISIVIAFFSIKKRITPNQLTVLMIPCAILASIFFACNGLVCTIIGTLLIHTWFAIDKADGEVARCTKRYSKFGEELDFLSHHFGHVFFICSFSYVMYSMKHASIIEALLLLSGMLFCEYSFRNMCSIQALIYRKIRINEDPNKKYDMKASNRKPSFVSITKRVLIFVIDLFHSCDNYVMIGSLIIYIDIFCGTRILFYLSIIFVFASLLNTFWQSLDLLKTAYKS